MEEAKGVLEREVGEEVEREVEVREERKRYFEISAEEREKVIDKIVRKVKKPSREMYEKTLRKLVDNYEGFDSFALDILERASKCDKLEHYIWLLECRNENILKGIDVSNRSAYTFKVERLSLILMKYQEDLKKFASGRGNLVSSMVAI